MAYVKVGESVDRYSGGDTRTTRVYVMDDKTGEMWLIPLRSYNAGAVSQKQGEWIPISRGKLFDERKE